MAKKQKWYGKSSLWRNLYVNRKYKDRLFKFLFRDNRDLLQLYNAVNGSHYTDPGDLEIHTLEDVIFMKMKNDLSFIIANSMNLYEHQSTHNPNMPLRGLLYFARQYEGLIAIRKDDIYSSKLVSLPTPKYVVFYNGTDELEDQTELYLSDAYESGRGSGCLECRAVVLNINRGHNRELMEKCRRLWEYSEFITEIRNNLENGYSLKQAVAMAIDTCIQEDVLTDILVKNRTEVLHMLLTEYDEKRHLKTVFREGFEEGELSGYSKGEQAGRENLLQEQTARKLEKGKSPKQIAEELEEDVEIIRKHIKNITSSKMR